MQAVLLGGALNMRANVSIRDGWWVSVSEKDAALAASGRPWKVCDLECADDPENHPRRIRLPGGPQYGKRREPALTERTTGSDNRRSLTESFVGPGTVHDAAGNRLPSPFLTYARRVKIPREWAGHRVFLVLENARYNVTAQINGKIVTRYVGGLEPHRVDVTDFLTPGQYAMLLITAGDSGVSGHRRFDPYIYTGTRLPTCREIENNLVHPVNYGGADRAVGNVRLEVVPPIRVDYVFANPSVSQGIVRYTVALRNDSDRPALVEVRSDAVGARKLLRRKTRVPAHSARLLRTTVRWPDAILWDLDNPHLYRLRTVLIDLRPGEAGSKLDEHCDTFGFREFSINGHSFYLNGRKVHLIGQSCHTSPDADIEIPLSEKKRILRLWKEKGHINHIRLHAKPQDKGWVEAADRVGLLITTETALWTTNFHSLDWAGSERACYENIRNHFFEALVRRDRNNPSVVIWSLSNEMSPITPRDLRNPKMAAMTRVFEKIIREAGREDPSRVIQMSSAMDFLGRLRMYNLHYPKSWQAFPDYPHTAYWIERPFLFPWYGEGRDEMPAWIWRRDKPLVLGEFTCVFGATPDNQASIIGDVAFERNDFGTALVQEALWPMEIHAYRRNDVSGFTAWACLCLEGCRQALRALRRPETMAHTRAVRPLAALLHTYRRRWFGGTDALFEFSMHNDTRRALELEFDAVLKDARGGNAGAFGMPGAVFGPAESKSFSMIFKLPPVEQPATFRLNCALRSGKKVVDRWSAPVRVFPLKRDIQLAPHTAILDPDGRMAKRLERAGIRGFEVIEKIEELENRPDLKALWVRPSCVPVGKSDRERMIQQIVRFVCRGGCAVLDCPPARIAGALPVSLAAARGFGPDNRLEITRAFVAAPFNPALTGLSPDDFTLWGEDYYVARYCFDIPQQGNVVPLLVAGTDRKGLTASPLLDIYIGEGVLRVSSLELIPKLQDEPLSAPLFARLACSFRRMEIRDAAVCVGEDSLNLLRQVGVEAEKCGPDGVWHGRVIIADGECLAADPEWPEKAIKSLADGSTVYLHDLGVEMTGVLVGRLGRKCQVVDGKAADGEHDLVDHSCELADGLTNNCLYWIVNKSKVAPWCVAPLHPRPASARVMVEGEYSDIMRLTVRGAVVAFRYGAGLLVIDNLRWQSTEIEDADRPRRYLTCLLTNIGVRLGRGSAGLTGAEFETFEERREQGHF